MKIVLDPGHGGHDSGADGPGGLAEAPTVLAICQYLLVGLESFGVGVRMTRTQDDFVELSARCAIANEWNADYFISVHLNSNGPTATGVETLYASQKGAGLAGSIQRAVVDATGDTDRGLKARSDLYVLNATAMPAVLVELGFISNPEFEAKVRAPGYKQLLGWAIGTGLWNFLGIKPPLAKGMPA